MGDKKREIKTTNRSMSRDFDITGFVIFPTDIDRMWNRNIQTIDTGQTLVYIVAFDPNGSEYSNQKLELKGIFSGDDATPRPLIKTDEMTMESVIDNFKYQDLYDRQYFPNTDHNRTLSIPLLSCTLVGWSKFSYEYKDRIFPWRCTFRELTNEGKKLYYNIKKLHNDKEVRILTFNNI